MKNTKLRVAKSIHPPVDVSQIDNIMSHKAPILTTIRYFQEVTQRTVISIQKYKALDIYGANEINICISSLEKIQGTLLSVMRLISPEDVDDEYVSGIQGMSSPSQTIDYVYVRSQLQNVNNDLSDIFRKYGTELLDDLIIICFGKNFLINSTWNQSKYEVIHKYFHPFQYKVISWKNDRPPSLVETVHCGLTSLSTSVPGDESDTTVHMPSSSSSSAITPNSTPRMRPIYNDNTPLPLPGSQKQSIGGIGNIGGESIIPKNKMIDDCMIVEKSENLDCFDLSRSCRSFKTRVYGMKLAIHNEIDKKTLIVSGIVDNVMIESIGSKYIQQKVNTLKNTNVLSTINTNNGFADTASFCRYVHSLSLKELLVYETKDVVNKYHHHMSQLRMIKQKPIPQVVKEFTNSELYAQRTTIIQLLLKENEHEFQYLAYLLYDLLSTDTAVDNSGFLGGGGGGGGGVSSIPGEYGSSDMDESRSGQNKSKHTVAGSNSVSFIIGQGGYGSTVDTRDQCDLFDSLPWNIKRYFKDAMKQTIQYTNSLCNHDLNKIPLEQQICLMKANDSIKEKAMLKLKEIRSKSEDSGSKARQYLEGLLRIPFGTYRHENILSIMDDIRTMFAKLLKNIHYIYPECSIPVSYNYTNIEIHHYLQEVREKYIHNITSNALQAICMLLTDSSVNRGAITYTILSINSIIKNSNYKRHKLCHSGKTIDFMKQEVIIFFNELCAFENVTSTVGLGPGDNQIPAVSKDTEARLKLIDAIYKMYSPIASVANAGSDTTGGKVSHSHHEYISNSNVKKGNIPNLSCLTYVNSELVQSLMIESIAIQEKWTRVNNYIQDTSRILDEAVHGHKRAKRHIERIIAQWINGKQCGHCFGFEGPPGVGKTSLAKKGLAHCLKDDEGNSRPFAFIAIGGSSNGSTLEGHNYTYVGSTWGRIVEILMETKCMNPIFFIDELDKVSKTEHGREIIGILTHLIDTTQNDGFQDKYFNGIDLDLSKALFVFSYNDVDAIDKVLLDRIHRIKFDHLSLDDKLTVTKKHLLPEMYDKMGLINMIELTDENILFIIEEYTCEPGVRKLKELLFEIIGEINLDYIQNLSLGSSSSPSSGFPVKVSNEIIRDKYLNERHPARHHKIHAEPSIGLINGLWANALGNGGVIPIEAKWYPSATMMDLKLTGMQGDVMKESMTVAKTLAWTLLDDYRQAAIVDVFDKTKTQGLHIHCPEGATPKDGPSAGTAITCVIYSLLMQRRIKNFVAITGEINLQGRVTMIGGLDLKILGGIRAGVTEFIYPAENEKDYRDFIAKYKDKPFLSSIVFHAVTHISEVIDLVFE